MGINVRCVRRVDSRGHGGPPHGVPVLGGGRCFQLFTVQTWLESVMCVTRESWVHWRRGRDPAHLGTRGVVIWALGVVRVTWVQGLQKPWDWRRLKAVPRQGAVHGSSFPIAPMQRTWPLPWESGKSLVHGNQGVT